MAARLNLAQNQPEFTLGGMETAEAYLIVARSVNFGRYSRFDRWGVTLTMRGKSGDWEFAMLKARTRG